MSIQSEVIRVQSRFGATTHNTLLKQDSGADKLLIMLPGWAYSCDFPMLYYLRNAALQQGYDVLSVEYGFQADHSPFDFSKSMLIVDDVNELVKPLLARNYKQVCVAGKSLGTFVAVNLAASLPNSSAALLLLTPMGGSIQVIDNMRTLVIIGTADPAYSAEEVAKSNGHPSVQWRVFDGLNHSLEVPSDWRESLKIIPEIIEACAEFLGETG